jgi:poly-beta-1,6-N-acetyl-D-glucosamine biosynthesis protein PgaD
MTGAANHPPRRWPPLIVATDVPRWIRWRDAVLTLLMWALFASMLELEFAGLLGPHLERLGVNVFSSDVSLLEFSGRLIPYLRTSVVLVVLLFVASLFTLGRRRRGLTLPAPPELAIAEEARRAGLDEPALIYARSAHIAVVHIDSDGGLRIEIRAPHAGTVPTIVGG